MTVFGWAPASDGQGWIGRWSPGIGDPTIVGWVTVVAYVAAAYLCWCVLHRRHGLPPPERKVWRTLYVATIALGVNKQLDLQSALTEVGRIVLRALGRYDQRQLVQLAFIAGVAAGGVVAVRWILRFAREAPRGTRVALYGFTSIVVFVGIRAASFHHIDRFIGFDVGGVRMNWLLELGGLIVLCVGARMRK
jgi:hypothetical protein